MSILSDYMQITRSVVRLHRMTSKAVPVNKDALCERKTVTVNLFDMPFDISGAFEGTGIKAERV